LSHLGISNSKRKNLNVQTKYYKTINQNSEWRKKTIVILTFYRLIFILFGEFFYESLSKNLMVIHSSEDKSNNKKTSIQKLKLRITTIKMLLLTNLIDEFRFFSVSSIPWKANSRIAYLKTEMSKVQSLILEMKIPIEVQKKQPNNRKWANSLKRRQWFSKQIIFIFFFNETHKSKLMKKLFIISF
jgi:hypothetical protein